MAKTNDLCLCIGNSARSQVAEAFLRTFAGDQRVAHSAGSTPKGLRPCTFQAIAGHRLFWPIDDPSRATGSEAEKSAGFRAVRDQIGQKTQDWLAGLGVPVAAPAQPGGVR
jgi:arsenate reductase